MEATGKPKEGLNPVGTLHETNAQVAAAPGNDVVLLDGGGMIRGTIVEVVPGKEITIQTAAGALRTVSADQVKYYGPVSTMPGATAAVTPAPAAAPAQKVAEAAVGTVKLHLGSDTDGLTYYVKGALPGLPESEGFTRLCTAPCDVSIPAGSYNFAATSGNSVKPALSKDAIILTADTTLSASHQSRAKGRTAGWAVFGIGMGLSVTLAAVAASKEAENCTASYNSYTHETSPSCTSNDARSNMFIASALSGIVGLLALIPALSRDEARIKADSQDHTKRAINPSIQWPALATGNLLVQF